MSKRSKTLWQPWSQRELALPSELELRRQAALKLAVTDRYLIAIPIPTTARVQWFDNDKFAGLFSITPTIHALLTGQQLSNAPFSSQKGDSWHHGLQLQNVIDFKDANCAAWWEMELAACAQSVGVELEVKVQVVRLEGGS